MNILLENSVEQAVRHLQPKEKNQVKKVLGALGQVCHFLLISLVSLRWCR